MKQPLIVIVALLGLASPVIAQSAPPAALPDGWTLDSNGSYAQSQSGVICAKTVGSYNFVRLDGASDPNILGVCVYSGGDVRVGEIRIRKFADGVGETPLAIQNDRVLMGKAPTGAPAGAVIKFAERMGPGPEIDGQQTSQAVITSLRGGLLVDCISLTKRDKDEAMAALKNFGHVCAFPGGPPP
jgi:hypothetical protein